MSFGRPCLRASPFYGAVLRYLGYEQGGRSATFEDWKRWGLGTPHEIRIVQVPFGHLAFCAADRADVDRFYAEALRPLEA